MIPKKLISAALAAAMLFSAALASGSGGISATDALTAEHEDSSLSLWFEHAREKVKITDTEPSGMTEYTAYMAKNEIEDIQFVLASEGGAEGLTASCTDFTDSEGNVIPHRIYKEYYVYAGEEGTMTPDAIPPLDGEFSLAAGKSQAFIIRLTSSADTPAGDYSAVISIYNSVGEEVKRAAVSAHVWNFTLPEDPGIDTAVYFQSSRMNNYYDSINGVYKMYYDYMLENRICAFNLPYHPASAQAEEYLNNDRVTAFRVGDYSYNDPYSDSIVKRIYTKLSQNPKWFDKHWFYLYDEPTLPSEYDGIIAEANNVESIFPNANMTVPVYRNSVYDADEKIDAVSVLLDKLNLMCPMSYAYVTEKDMNDYTASGGTLSVHNLNFGDSSGIDWDALYGTYEERVDAAKASGKDIKEWWYVCATMGQTSAANLLITDDGIDPEMIFWQAKQNDVEGFLYYYSNYWVTGNEIDDLYIPVGSSGLHLYGDGVLLYPGPCFGTQEPVGSLRMEAMRDGIEEYAMLSMYADAVGDSEMQKIISKVSTNVLLFTEDKDLFVSVRRELGDKLEAALNAEEPATVPGDVNESGAVDNFDMIMLKRFIIGKVTLTDKAKAAADVHADGRINVFDLIKIKRLSLG